MAKPILPICVKCNVSMFPKKNGATALLMAYNPPEPYEAYSADLLECPRCHYQVLSGYGGVNWHNFNTRRKVPNIEDQYVFPVYESSMTANKAKGLPPHTRYSTFIVHVIGGEILAVKNDMQSARKVVTDYLGEERLSRSTFTEEGHQYEGQYVTKLEYIIGQGSMGIIYHFRIVEMGHKNNE